MLATILSLSSCHTDIFATKISCSYLCKLELACDGWHVPIRQSLPSLRYSLLLLLEDRLRLVHLVVEHLHKNRHLVREFQRDQFPVNQPTKDVEETENRLGLSAVFKSSGQNCSQLSIQGVELAVKLLVVL